MAYRTLVLITILFFCGNSFAEEFVVSDIRVNGLQKISIDAVLQNLIVKPNDKFDTKQSHDMIKQLFDTGFFKQIDIERDGTVLVIKVVEYPSIGELLVKGIKKNDKIKKILADNNLEEGRIFNKSNLSKVETELKYHYFSQKRYGVKIDSEVSTMSRNRVRVELDIYEGDVAKIKEIKIIGNKSFDQDELLAQLLHKETNLISWFTKSDQYSKEKLEEDLEILRSYYLNRGYLNFNINSTQVSLTPDKKNVFITINVEEGDKYILNEISVADLPISKEHIDVALQDLEKGKAFSRKEVINAQKNLELALGQYGYSLSKVKITTSVDDVKKNVNLVFLVDDLRKVLIRRINIVGNSLTKDEVIRREVSQMEGATVDTVKIKNSKESIQRLGFATSIDVKTNLVSGTSDQVDLDYVLEEQRFNTFSMEFGYNQRDKYIFKLGSDLKNVVGTGKDVNFLFESTGISENYRTYYYNPYFTLDGIGFGVNGSFNRTNFSKTTDIADYSTGNSLAEIFWSFPIGSYEKLTTKLGYENTQLTVSSNTEGVSKEIASLTKVHGYSYPNFFMDIGWSHNSLNKYIFPTTGISHGFNFKVTSPKDKLSYWILQYDAKFYYPLNRSEDFIFSTAINLGYGSGYKKTAHLPFFRNFFAGGMETVRGYDESSLGPREIDAAGQKGKVLGGNLLLVGSVALIFPNPMAPKYEALRTSLFFDAGQVYDTKVEENVVKGLRCSVGVAITWNSPLGAPLTFSYAKPLNSEPDDKTKPMQFGFSARF